ncbi:MAG: rhamnulokinase [Lentisphaeria bacterium]|nr:rhamnulokinase [Lentisphaeria bacterium]
MRKVFLAFDLGASSGRGILGVLTDGGNLSLQEVHRFENGPMPKDGSLYWDYPALCAELKKGIDLAFQAEPVIDGIGIDTWGVDYVLFDRRTMEPKRLPFNYRDSRTDHAPEKVFAKISRKDLYRRTGIQHMPLNTIFQLAAHLETYPEDFDHAVMLPIPDALAFYLGGAATAEYTECSTTGLLDPAARTWDWELIDLIGLPRSIFPEIVQPGTVCGSLKPEFGHGDVPIYKVASHDTASAVAAVPAPEGGPLYISCGTWALLGAETNRPDCSAEAEKVPFTNEGGVDGTIRFLSNIMGSWLLQETRRNWKQEGKSLSFAEMETMARRAVSGKFLINPCDNLFLPPDDMPGRIRRFCEEHGQGAVPDDKALLRAVYDSLALAFARGIDGLEKLTGKTYPVIHTVGGGTKDELLMQLTADASGKVVEAGPIEATAIGNLLMQMRGAGVCPDLAAAREWVKKSFPVKRYTPDPESGALYAACREQFLKFFA